MSGLCPAVNNAALDGYTPRSKASPDELWLVFFRTNVQGPLLVARAVMPYMPRGGRIICISSVISKLVMSAMPLYAASTPALDTLAFSWATNVGSWLTLLS